MVCLQIVYILDQVKAMEKEMCERIADQGLDHSPEIIVITRLIPKAQGTSCNQAREEINGTKHSRIVRVPFKTKKGDVLQEWVSRCGVWHVLHDITCMLRCHATSCSRSLAFTGMLQGRTM